MGRFIVAVRAVFVVAVLAVSAVWWLGCDGDGGNPSGGGTGGGGGSNNCGKDGTAGSCKTVTIGGRTWMGENLNYQTGNSWCYDNNSSYCNKYGRLYTWDAARTACPSGWHLPSRDEWGALVTAAGGSLVAGKALKSTSGWNNNGNGTDTYGFSALPGGYYFGSSFYNAGNYGRWWTATENSSGIAYGRLMYYNFNGVDEDYYDKSYGFSVRCVAD